MQETETTNVGLQGCLIIWFNEPDGLDNQNAVNFDYWAIYKRMSKLFFCLFPGSDN